MEFSRQKYWSGLSFPSPGDLPDSRMEPGSPTLQADSLPSEPSGKPPEYTLDFPFICCRCCCLVAKLFAVTPLEVCFSLNLYSPTLLISCFTLFFFPVYSPLDTRTIQAGVYQMMFTQRSMFLSVLLGSV